MDLWAVCRVCCGVKHPKHVAKHEAACVRHAVCLWTRTVSVLSPRRVAFHTGSSDTAWDWVLTVQELA